MDLMLLYKFFVVLGALLFLMVMAYKGHSIILMAPIAAMGAVCLIAPHDLAPMFSGVFMENMVVFVKNYFPVFLLGAVYGKLIELSGFSKSIVEAVIRWIGQTQAVLVIVIVCALLTYGGVSLFVVAFAVYPFAAELFRANGIPKRIIPGVLALGALSFTMDAFPGTPQIQNIIPSGTFGTTSWAAPLLGISGSIFIFVVGLLYLNWRVRSAVKNGETYDSGQTLHNEPAAIDHSEMPNPWLAFSALVLIGVANFILTFLIQKIYMDADGKLIPHVLDKNELPGLKATMEISPLIAIWAVEGALLIGILFIILTSWKTIRNKIAEGSKAAVGGAMLAGLNTASEYGFGAVIAALPGFVVVRDALGAVPDVLVNSAVSVTALAGITGSASGGMSIALAALGDHFKTAAEAAGIPMEVMHRVVAMASGGMDTLPHNGAVITVLAVCGLTHRQSYKDIFAITVLKTLTVFVVIGLYYTTGMV